MKEDGTLDDGEAVQFAVGHFYGATDLIAFMAKNPEVPFRKIAFVVAAFQSGPMRRWGDKNGPRLTERPNICLWWARLDIDAQHAVLRDGQEPPI